MAESTGTRDFPRALVGALVALFGLAFALQGGWLASLGGSWYYLIAGLGLLLSRSLADKPMPRRLLPTGIAPQERSPVPR